MTPPAAPDAAEVLEQACHSLSERLPAGWSVGARPAGALTVTAPDGVSCALTVRAVTGLPPRHSGRFRGEAAVLIAPFLSPQTRERLTTGDVNFIDSTGNIRLSVARPGLFVQTTGADRDPGPRHITRHSLKGPRAARLVRTLCDTALPASLSDLAARAGIDVGYASRLLAWLEGLTLISRTRRGPVNGVDLAALLGRWAADYNVLTTHRASLYLDPSSATSTADRFPRTDLRFAITGGAAASRLGIPAPRRPLLIYCDRPERLAGALALTATSGDPDVVMLESADGFVFDRTWSTGGLTFASPSQVAVDLLTCDEAGREAGHRVIDWLSQRRAR